MMMIPDVDTVSTLGNNTAAINLIKAIDCIPSQMKLLRPTCFQLVFNYFNFIWPGIPVSNLSVFQSLKWVIEFACH